MKKVIKKYWGIGLIVMLLSSLCVVAAPVSAADPLNWETKVDAPSGLFALLAPGTDVVDYDVAAGGMTMYAITRAPSAVTCTVTTGITETDNVTETVNILYTNENGVTGQAGTIVVPDSAVATTACTITLATGDNGISDVTGMNTTGTASDASAGVITVWGGTAGTTSLGTLTFNGVAGVFADAVVNTTADTLRQSTMGGSMWTTITTRLNVPPTAAGTPILDNLDYVAIAPEDANVIVVADATPVSGVGAVISINGGSTWTSMGIIQSGGANVCTAINGIAISPVVTGGFRYVVAYGAGTGATNPGIFYYNYGAGVGSWKNACVAAATDFVSGPDLNTAPAASYSFVNAFEFSKNFPSDYMGVAVLEENTAAIGDIVDLHILSFNSRTWDLTLANDYPVTIYTGTNAALVVDKADLALLPDYDGGDEALRIVFVGAAISDPAGTEAGGVWRCYDNAAAVQVLGAAAAIGVSSVAYDGTNLAAGESASNRVWRSADPLTTSPTFFPSRSLKRIGIAAVGNDMLNIKFVGETLYGSKLGLASCISKSTDYGNTWNDFTLLDSALTVIDDIYMTAAGDPWYVSAHDGSTSSVYRMSMFSVTRVLCVAETAGAPDFILRGLASDPGIVYAADEGGTVLYYSADGGLERWYQRGSVPVGIADLTVESAQVIYIGDAGTVNVYKSVNAGFVWGLPANTRLGGFNSGINTLISVGENNIVVAGNGGGVNYSKDGGTTWTPTMGVLNTFWNVQVAASGMGADDYLFAIEEFNNTVWRCSLSPANFLGEWESMNFPPTASATAGAALATPVITTSNEVNTGLVYYNGVLYVLQTDAAGTPASGLVPAVAAGTSYITRSAAATIPGSGAHAELFWGTRYAETGSPFLGAPTTLTFNTSPTALKVSDGPPGSVMLYAIDTATLIFGAAAPGVKYFDDAIILSGPALIGPADGTRIDIVSPVMGTPANVNFTWSRMSLATGYFLFIALDAGFTEGLGPPIVVASTRDPVSSIQAGNTFLPGTTYYWRVSASTPISSGFSETRSFVVQPTAASVPTIASPENGGVIDNTSPAFSWTPAAGSTMYQFQLSTTPDFATTLVDEQLAAAGIAPALTLDRGTTYFWRVKSLQPVEGDWSTVANFMVAEAAPAPTPPVVIETVPPPVIEIPPAPPATVIEIPPAPAVEEIAPAYIWAIIIIGAVLVIAVIVLIVRTRRQV